MKRTVWVVLVLGAFLVLSVGLVDKSRSGMSTQTPKQLVVTYEGLAEAILAVKKTEASLVQSILATTFSHAEAVFSGIQSGMETGADVRGDVENLATLVAQLGNEGDAAVAGVRKRLLEGGHHHNAAGEKKGIYDEGFVHVTRAARKVFLEAGQAIGKMAMKPDLTALEAQWKMVEKEYKSLMGKGGR